MHHVFLTLKIFWFTFFLLLEDKEEMLDQIHATLNDEGLEPDWDADDDMQFDLHYLWEHASG